MGYDDVDSRIESKSISPETVRRESPKKLGSCKLNYNITNSDNALIFLDKPKEKLSLGIYEKQYANSNKVNELSISRIAVDLRDSTANFTPMLEQLQFKVIDLALERLKQKPVILIDIFEREKGGLPKLSDTHTVCLWKQQDDKLLIIDPSNADFSNFLKGLIQKQALDLEIKIYNDGKKFYQSDLLGPLKYALSRDCIDIAVKIGLQIQEDLSDSVTTEDIRLNISNLSNQSALNKTLEELGSDGIIVRALQSTDSKVREDTRKILKDNAPILKYVKFSTIKQAKNFVEQLQFSTFSTEVEGELKDLEALMCDIERKTIRTSFDLITERIFDDDTHDKMFLENQRRYECIKKKKEDTISTELVRIKASTTEKDYIQVFKDLDKELKETAMRFSNIDEFLSFSNLCRQIKEIQGKIDDNSAFSRIDIPILKKLPKKTLNKDQQKFLDEVLENKIYLDSENCTELYVATKNNDTDSVNKILAKWNKDYKSIAKNLVALKDESGQTALHWAAGKGYKGICEVLVDNMGLDDIVTKAAGRYNYTALHMAVQANNLDIVNLILQKHKDIINLTDEFDQTALHWAAGKGNKDICKVLIENMEPKDIATQAAGSYTALHTAVKADNLDIVNLILQKHKDIINLTDESGQTALHWAAGKGYKGICEVLVDNMDIKTIGSKTKEGKTLFHFAVSNNDINLLNYFLQEEKTKNFLNEADQYGRTPLYYACLERSIDVFNELIEHIAQGDLITQDRNGNTPLHAICNSFSKRNMSDVSAMIEKLIEKNAAIVNITNRFEQTPLHFAVLKEELDICKTLLKYIDRELVTQGDINGYDVVRLASEKHFHEGLKLLNNKLGVNKDPLNESEPVGQGRIDENNDEASLALLSDIDKGTSAEELLETTSKQVIHSNMNTNLNQWYEDERIEELLERQMPEDKATVLAITQFENKELLEDNLNSALECIKKDGLPVLMPIHVHGNHWVGAVIRKQADGKIQVIYNDPKGHSIQDEENIITFIGIIQRHEKDANIIDLQFKQQYNDDDCGPFTVDNLVRLSMAPDIDNVSRGQLIERDVLPRNNTGAMIRLEHEELLLGGNKDRLETSDEDQNIDISLVNADSDDPDSTGVMGDTST